MILFDKSHKFSDRFFPKPNVQGISAISALFSENILKKYRIAEFIPISVILIYLLLRYFKPINKLKDIFAVKRIDNLYLYSGPFIKNIWSIKFEDGDDKYSSVYRSIGLPALEYVQESENVILNRDLFSRNIIFENKSQNPPKILFKAIKKQFKGACPQFFNVPLNTTDLALTYFLLFQSFRRSTGLDSYLPAYFKIRKGKPHGGSKSGKTIEQSPGVSALLNVLSQNKIFYYKKYFSRNNELESENYTKQNYVWKRIHNRFISHQKIITTLLNNQNSLVSLAEQVDDSKKTETTHKTLTTRFIKIFQKHTTISEKRNNLISSMTLNRLIQKQASHLNQGQKLHQSENLDSRIERPYNRSKMSEDFLYAGFNVSNYFGVNVQDNLDGFEGNKSLGYRKRSNFNKKLPYSDWITRFPFNMKSLEPSSNQINTALFMSKDSVFTKQINDGNINNHQFITISQFHTVKKKNQLLRNILQELNAYVSPDSRFASSSLFLIRDLYKHSSKKFTNAVNRQNSGGSGHAPITVTGNGGYYLQDVVNPQKLHIRNPVRIISDSINNKNKTSISIRRLKNGVANNGVLSFKKDQNLLFQKDGAIIFNETMPLIQHDIVHKNNLIFRSPVLQESFKSADKTNYDSERYTGYPSLTINSNSRPVGQIEESKESSSKFHSENESSEEVAKKIVHEYFQKMPLKTINIVAEKVYDLIENRIHVEQDRRGWI